MRRIRNLLAPAIATAVFAGTAGAAQAATVAVVPSLFVPDMSASGG